MMPDSQRIEYYGDPRCRVNVAFLINFSTNLSHETFIQYALDTRSFCGKASSMDKYNVLRISSFYKSLSFKGRFVNMVRNCFLRCNIKPSRDKFCIVYNDSNFLQSVVITKIPGC